MKYYIVERRTYTIGKSKENSYTINLAEVLEVDNIYVDDSGFIQYNEAMSIAGGCDNLTTNEPYELRTVEDEAIFTNVESALKHYEDITA